MIKIVEMNEENKYYTPEIIEFYNGFEYETSINTKDWYTHIFTINEKNLWLQEFKNSSFVKYIRVKYLDQEDLESLGFIEYSTYPKYMFKKNDYYIHLHPNDNVEIIKEPIKYLKDFTGRLFLGTIKNKSELIKILKMIGINE